MATSHLCGILVLIAWLMRSICDNIKRISFKEKIEKFIVAIPLIHHTTWTFHQWFFFPSLQFKQIQKSLILAYYADWEFSVWSTKN